MTDRAEQGQPELLGILLIALHLNNGKPMLLPRTVGPGAQQRRLSAAGRSRDDRHLLGRREIQGSEKITPVDQPESCPSHQASVRRFWKYGVGATVASAGLAPVNGA